MYAQGELYKDSLKHLWMATAYICIRTEYETAAECADNILFITV